MKQHNGLIAFLFILPLLMASNAYADNEAVYNPVTKTLHLPSVVLSNDLWGSAYSVDMTANNDFIFSLTSVTDTDIKNASIYDLVTRKLRVPIVVLSGDNSDTAFSVMMTGDENLSFSATNITPIIPFTQALLENKTFFAVEEDYPYLKSKWDFNANGTIYYSVTSEPEIATYTITNGILSFDTNVENQEVIQSTTSLLAVESDYYYIQRVGFYTDWEDKSHEWDVNLIESFNNDITLLKDYFLSNGLWRTTITQDGKVLKYPGTLMDGKWWIEDNIFYFVYPDDELGVDSRAVVDARSGNKKAPWLLSLGAFFMH